MIYVLRKFCIFLLALFFTFSKIFEKCVYQRVYSFLEKNNLIFTRQFGFRSGHSSNHKIVNLVRSIRKYIDNDNYVCSVFIDLEKVFDIVDYQILFQKLYHYSIRGLAHNWFRSYLSNRQQLVLTSGFFFRIDVNQMWSTSRICIRTAFVFTSLI